MLGFKLRREKETAQPKPVLDLSGPRLRRAFEHLTASTESTGGIERYVGALALKASLFQEILGKGKVEEMSAAEFLDLAAFITPGRRRMTSSLGDDNTDRLRAAIVELLAGWSDVSHADTRLNAFMATFPQDKSHRWVRDLGAEILHFSAPDHYPLMTRWMWDARVGTGVLREIWHADRMDMSAIDIADDYATFAVLYEELGGFLADNGVFRDHVFYTDLLCAHVYAGYINDQGGQYLRSDFTEEIDPLVHTRRMLGLDAIDTETGRTRLKLIDGKAHTLGSDTQLLGGGRQHADS